MSFQELMNRAESWQAAVQALMVSDPYSNANDTHVSSAPGGKTEGGPKAVSLKRVETLLTEGEHLPFLFSEVCVYESTIITNKLLQ